MQLVLVLNRKAITWEKIFKKNLLRKAKKTKFFSKRTKLVCIADDSGLEIDILDTIQTRENIAFKFIIKLLNEQRAQIVNINGKIKGLYELFKDSFDSIIKKYFAISEKRVDTYRYKRTQGKLSNMHALGIIAETAGVKMGTLGTTTFRPPYTPLTFGTIVGRNVGEYFDIFRKKNI